MKITLDISNSIHNTQEWCLHTDISVPVAGGGPITIKGPTSTWTELYTQMAFYQG